MKHRTINQAAFRYFQVIAFAIMANTAFGETEKHDSQHISVSGVEIYYGIKAANAIIPKSEIAAHDGHMTAQKHASSHSHLVVSLFDSKDGHRITDARVVARVTPLGLGSEEKTLSHMHDNNVISYGNIFTLDDELPNTIHLEIRLNGQEQPITTEFTYRP